MGLFDFVMKSIRILGCREILVGDMSCLSRSDPVFVIDGAVFPAPAGIQTC